MRKILGILIAIILITGCASTNVETNKEPKVVTTYEEVFEDVATLMSVLYNEDLSKCDNIILTDNPLYDMADLEDWKWTMAFIHTDFKTWTLVLKHDIIYWPKEYYNFYMGTTVAHELGHAKTVLDGYPFSEEHHGKTWQNVCSKAEEKARKYTSICDDIKDKNVQNRVNILRNVSIHQEEELNGKYADYAFYEYDYNGEEVSLM